MPYLAAKKHQI